MDQSTMHDDLRPLAGSIEYSIWDDLMTEEGELWQPTEEDTTLLRCILRIVPLLG